jgi:hypothetical protein
MTTPDKDFHDFFAEMRIKDEQVPIPEFNELITKRSRSRNLFIPLGVAASVTLLIGIYFYFGADKESVISQQTELTIILVTEKNGYTQSLISNESSIDAWQSPSDFLIDDFNEW